MVAKRPQDRPEWEEVLKLLTLPAIDPIARPHTAIEEAVVSAVAKRQEQEKQKLESARRADEAAKQHLLYSHSCKSLLERFRPAIEQFNQRFQLGEIEIAEEYGTTYYRLPTGNTIQATFFPPSQAGIRVQGGVVIGGGWLGLAAGRSANLVLLRESVDDLYGRWVACEVKFMALVGDPRKFIGQFGITAQTVEPFGFHDQFFYDQIGYAQGGLHVFTYNFIHDVEDYFACLIADGCR